MCHYVSRWYGDKDPPTTCFVERKTHRESWKGEESVKERFTLPEDKMVPYLEGEYTLEQAQSDLKAKVLLPSHCLGLRVQYAKAVESSALSGLSRVRE